MTGGNSGTPAASKRREWLPVGHGPPGGEYGDPPGRHTRSRSDRSRQREGPACVVGTKEAGRNEEIWPADVEVYPAWPGRSESPVTPKAKPHVVGRKASWTSLNNSHEPEVVLAGCDQGGIVCILYATGFNISLDPHHPAGGQRGRIMRQMTNVVESI